jgi:pilus assembly protein Flp/PilA
MPGPSARYERLYVHSQQRWVPGKDEEGGERKLMGILQTIREREEGQALVEYTLILALVSVVAILALTSIGNDVVSKLNDVVTALGG